MSTRLSNSSHAQHRVQNSTESCKRAEGPQGELHDANDHSLKDSHRSICLYQCRSLVRELCLSLSQGMRAKVR
mgnify:CR=1 FL=1